MSDIPDSAGEKPIKQPNDDLSGSMKNFSANTGNFYKNSTPNLADMPLDVVGMIIDRSKYKEQLILRKTSKSLRSLVDEQKPACKSIKVCRLEKEIIIDFTNQYVMYTADAECDNRRFHVKVVRDDFEKIAFDDLASTLRNPKLQLEKLKVCSFPLEVEEREKFYENIRRVFESLNHQLSVKKCKTEMCHSSGFPSILPFLKPGVLKTISIYQFSFGWGSNTAEMDQIASLEQWKQAEKLRLFDAFDVFPMKYATHFKEIKIHEDGIRKNKFVRIRDYLSNSKLDKWEHCKLKARAIFVPFDSTNHGGTLVSSDDSTKEIYHYPIPDSDYYLEFFKTSDRFIHILY